MGLSLWEAKSLTAFSGEVKVPGSCLDFLDFFILELHSILPTDGQHNVQLPPVNHYTPTLEHTTKYLDPCSEIHNRTLKPLL